MPPDPETVGPPPSLPEILGDLGRKLAALEAWAVQLQHAEQRVGTLGAPPGVPAAAAPAIAAEPPKGGPAASNGTRPPATGALVAHWSDLVPLANTGAPSYLPTAPAAPAADAPSGLPAVAPAAPPAVTSVTVREVEATVREVLLSAYCEASALVQEAHRADAERLARAEEQRREFVAAAESAGQHLLETTEAFNAACLREAEEQASALMTRALRRIGQLLEDELGAAPLPGGPADQLPWPAPAAGPAARLAADGALCPAAPLTPVAGRTIPGPDAGAAPSIAPAPEPATAAIGAAAPTGEGAAAPAFPPTPMVMGGVELAAGPFTRFSQLGSFTRALRALPGVESVATRHFFNGLVQLRVRYDGPVPLATRLLDLRDFAPRVLSASASRIELRVQVAEQDGVVGGSSPGAAT